jgi:hypothetical protein
MSARPDALALKQLLSPLLLEVEGVSGVGAPGGRLTVYLEADDPSVRKRVKEIVARAAPAETPHFEVTGAFRKQ